MSSPEPTSTEGLANLLVADAASGIITFASPVLERMLGFANQSLAGKHIGVLDRQRDRNELSVFLANAAHDLVGPMNQAACLAGLLVKRYGDAPDESARDILSHLESAAQRMSTLIAGLRSYLSVMTASPNLAPVDANAALTAALFVLQPVSRPLGAAISMDALPEVLADGNALITVFETLVSNALRFRKPDMAPAVHVSAQRFGDDWTFAINDNGIGIPTPDIARVTEPFVRLQGREHPGAGLGLAIARHIVETHGGRLSVTSQPGVGTTVFFTLRAPA